MNMLSLQYSKVASPAKNPEICIKLNPCERCAATNYHERMQSLSVGLSACGLYLYLALHANGSCETSQTFFPTVTFHQSGRGTRGPREDGSWSAPSHWLFGRWSWRPMARGPGSGHSRGNFSLQSSYRLHINSGAADWAPPPGAGTGPFYLPDKR